MKTLLILYLCAYAVRGSDLEYDDYDQVGVAHPGASTR